MFNLLLLIQVQSVRAQNKSATGPGWCQQAAGSQIKEHVAQQETRYLQRYAAVWQWEQGGGVGQEKFYSSLFGFSLPVQ